MGRQCTRVGVWGDNAPEWWRTSVRVCRWLMFWGMSVCLFVFTQLWTELGFRTRTFTDLGGYDMRHELRELAKQDHTGYNCVIVSILTHGVEGKLYASDGELLPVEELIALFNADVIHKSLIGKPRLFFLQVSQRSDAWLSWGVFLHWDEDFTMHKASRIKAYRKLVFRRTSGLKTAGLNLMKRSSMDRTEVWATCRLSIFTENVLGEPTNRYLVVWWSFSKRERVQKDIWKKKLRVSLFHVEILVI